MGMGLASSGCGAPASPGRLPVAIIDGNPITVADLAAYLAENLAGVESEEPAAQEDLDRVKSRLFDNLVDEKLLQTEAERRGIQVSDEELASYLDSGSQALPSTQAADDARREMARLDLTAQKLREQFALSEAHVDPAEVDAYVAQHGDDLKPRPRLTIRSIALGSPALAERVRKEILRRKKSFAQAAAAYGMAPREGEPQQVVLDTLPEDVRAAIGRLRPGQVSVPVMVQGVPHLFYLESRPSTQRVDAKYLRERAAEELFQRKAEAAAGRLLRELKERSRIEIRVENLPFHYVPEAAS